MPKRLPGGRIRRRMSGKGASRRSDARSGRRLW
jgi:hypothetical protein